MANDPTPDAFERQLAQALARVDPPAGFADRIMGHAGSPAPLSASAATGTVPPPARNRLLFRRPVGAHPSRVGPATHLPQALWAGALAAGLAVAVAGGMHVRERALETRREELTAQYETAWRVTNAVTTRALAETRRNVDEDLARSLERQGIHPGASSQPSTRQPD